MQLKRLISATLLIAGTTVGAGMLGIPLVTGAAGFWPAVLITGLAWLYMLCTGLIFLEVSLWFPEGSNVLSMSKRFLGFKGKWFAGSMFCFLYYCLMVAYFAAGAPTLTGFIGDLFGVSLDGIPSYVIFGLIFAIIVGLGAKSIDRVNIMLIVAMIVAYFSLIGVGYNEINPERLRFTKWSGMLGSVPILFSAFGYHNIIPSLCNYLKKDRKILQISIFLGTFIPFIVYVVWQWLVIGTISQNDIELTLNQGKTAAQALQYVTGNSIVPMIATYFAFFAIATSLLGVAFSMVDFLHDAWKDSPISTRRSFLCLVTFLPPFLFVCVNPALFEKALSLAGGFGESIMNGLLPITLLWIGRYQMGHREKKILWGGKWSLALLYLGGVLVILIEFKYLFFGH